MAWISTRPAKVPTVDDDEQRELVEHLQALGIPIQIGDPSPEALANPRAISIQGRVLDFRELEGPPPPR